MQQSGTGFASFSIESWSACFMSDTGATMRAANTAAADRQLFFSAVKGSSTSYRRIVSRYAPLVQAEVCTMLPLLAPYAKPLAAAIFREAYRHLPRLRRPARLRQWIVALTRRACAVVVSRRERLGGGVGGIAGRFFRAVGESQSILFEKALFPAAFIRGRHLDGVAARFGRIRYARRMPVVPCSRGLLARAGDRLVKLPAAARRVFYYHVVADKSLEEISRLLRISPAAASARLLRAFRALGAVPVSVKTENFAALRSLALLPAVALEEESVIDSQFDRVQYAGEHFSEVLRHLRLSMIRLRKEAKDVRLTTKEIEKLSLKLPRMILSPHSGYRWNRKARTRKPRLVPVAASAALHAAVLGILALVILGLAGVRRHPARVNVSLSRYHETDEKLEELEDDWIITPERVVQPPEAEPAKGHPAELSEEEIFMELLIEALRKEPSDLLKELAPSGDDVGKAGQVIENELMEELLEELRESLASIEKPRIVPPWEKSPTPARGSAREARGRPAADRRDGTPGGRGVGSNDELDEERRERARRWRLEAHKKLKEKIERVRVTTECFGALKDIAYKKKSAFFSLYDAQQYAQNQFLEDMVEKVAKKCGVDGDRVRSIWDSRKTTHPKTVRLGISGTRLVEHRTSNWLGTDPIIRKRVIEYLVATAHCKIRKVYKEPCSTCGGKGYVLRMYMRPQGTGPGMTFYRVPCPLCKGLGYELVIVYE